MSMREPDLEGWNRYNPEKVPEEKRRLILRDVSDYGVPRYHVLTIINGKNGFCLTEFGTVFWNRWKGTGTHWVWLDELKVVNTTN